MIKYEYTEGPTGCSDDGDSLSHALRQIPRERLNQILKEELPQMLTPAQQKERNVSRRMLARETRRLRVFISYLPLCLP